MSWCLTPLERANDPYETGVIQRIWTEKRNGLHEIFDAEFQGRKLSGCEKSLEREDKSVDFCERPEPEDLKGHTGWGVRSTGLGRGEEARQGRRV